MLGNFCKCALDYKTGFGGQFGVQKQMDKSAVGWEHHEELQKHESQKDYSKGLTKFTFSKTDFSQNSHFQILLFDKTHNFKITFLTKFTFSKSHF